MQLRKNPVLYKKGRGKKKCPFGKNRFVFGRGEKGGEPRPTSWTKEGGRGGEGGDGARKPSGQDEGKFAEFIFPFYLVKGGGGGEGRVALKKGKRDGVPTSTEFLREGEKKSGVSSWKGRRQCHILYLHFGRLKNVAGGIESRGERKRGGRIISFFTGGAATNRWEKKGGEA